MMNALDGVFGIGADQTVLFWNRACESMTGISAHEAIGSRCHELLRGHDLNGRPLCRADCTMGALTRGGPPPTSVPLRIAGRDGERIQVCMGTMLMPATGRGHWNVIHVLRRGRSSHTEDLFACGCGADAVPGSGAGPCQAKAQKEAMSRLTARERDVLRLLAEGTTTERIGERLNISGTTVRNHLQRLMAKLDVHSRHEAVALAHRVGWV